MKKLKRPTISRSKEQQIDIAVGESRSKNVKIENNKDSTEANPSSKLCQLCQKRPYVNLSYGKWCCCTCKAKTRKWKTECKKHAKDNQDNSGTSVHNIIQTGAFKSMFTIQLGSDGKRSVKANQDCEEPLEKKLHDSAEESEGSYSTKNVKLCDVENSNGIVIIEEGSLNSTSENKVDNDMTIQTKESNMIIPFNIVSSNKITEKCEISSVQKEVNHMDKMNGEKEILIESKSSTNNSSHTNNNLEKPSNEFRLKPDSSLFGCVKKCFDHLEEINLNLFLEYVCNLKKSNICLNSKMNVSDTYTVVESTSKFHCNKEEEDQNFIDCLKNKTNTTSSNLETPKISSSLCMTNKQDINNFIKETLSAEEISSLEKTSVRKQLSSKQQRTLHTDSLSNSLNNENKNSCISQITSETVNRTNISEKGSSSTSALKHKPSPLKQNEQNIVTAQPFSVNLSFNVQNESNYNLHNKTKLFSQNKCIISQNDAILTENFRKTGLIENGLPRTENTATNKDVGSSHLTEKEILPDDNISQCSLSELKETRLELNLLNTEHETQYSSEKSSVNNDLYSHEAETLDYEPEDEVTSIEPLKFAEVFEVSEFQKADFDEMMYSLEDDIKSRLFNSSAQNSHKNSKERKNSVWDIDSDDDNLDAETKDSQVTSSSPELLCTVDEDEEKYIDDKGFTSQPSPSRSEISSQISSSASNISTVNETLLAGKGNEECENVQVFIETETKQYKKQILDNVVTSQNENSLRYDFRKLKGYCYHFLRNGTCSKRQCKFIHVKPPLQDFKDNRYKIAEHPQHNQYSGSNRHSEYVKKENINSDINSNESKSPFYRIERPDNHIIADTSLDPYIEQFGVSNTGRHEMSPRKIFQNTNNYQALQQGNISILQLMSENHWTDISHCFDLYFHNGTFIKHLKNALCNHQPYVGSKFQQFVHFVTTENNQEFEKEKVYILGQIGCCIILEAHSAGNFETAFEVLNILHQYDINYYYLQQNINQSLGFPLWGIVTSSWIALIAVDICVHLEKVAEAIQILEECNWAAPSPELTPEVKKKETLMRINVFQRLMEIMTKKPMTDFVIKILKKILDVFSEDLGDTDMQTSMPESIKQFYKYYMTTLIDCQDIDSALSLYMYFWKLKPSLYLNSEIHRALIVLANRSNKELRARNLFQTCLNMGVYKIGEPSLSSLPHCLNVQTCWTPEEMYLVLNHYLGQLFNSLAKWGTNFNGVSSQELFSLHIVFKESPLVQNTDSHFHFLSPVRLHESRERMTAAIKQLTFPLDFEQKTERTIHVKPNSLHNYFILWEIDNKDKDPNITTDKDASFISSLQISTTNFTLSSKNSSVSESTDIPEVTDSTEIMKDDGRNPINSLNNKAFSSHVVHSSSALPYSDQAIDHSSHKKSTKVIVQETHVAKNCAKNSSDNYSLLTNRDENLSERIHGSGTNESYTGIDFVQKPKSANLLPFIRNLEKNSIAKENKTSLLMPHHSVNKNCSASPSQFKSHPINITSSSVPNSNSQVVCENKQLPSNSTTHLTPVCTKKMVTSQMSHKHNSNLTVKNKAALAKKCRNTPEKLSEKIKLKRVPFKQESMKSLSVQKCTNINSYDSSKVYNYIKSQLLCHHKGNSSDKDLNRKAQELSKKFISKYIEGDIPSTTILDRKRMKTLVDFAKRHIKERNHLA